MSTGGAWFVIGYGLRMDNYQDSNYPFDIWKVVKMFPKTEHTTDASWPNLFDAGYDFTDIFEFIAKEFPKELHIKVVTEAEHNYTTIMYSPPMPWEMSEVEKILTKEMVDNAFYDTFIHYLVDGVSPEQFKNELGSWTVYD